MRRLMQPLLLLQSTYRNNISQGYYYYSRICNVSFSYFYYLGRYHTMRRGSLYDTYLVIICYVVTTSFACNDMIGFWWWTSLKASQATAFPADSALTGHIISYNLLVTLTTAG